MAFISMYITYTIALPFKGVHRKNSVHKWRALRLAAEEIYLSFLQRSELLLHLRSRPCKKKSSKLHSV